MKLAPLLSAISTVLPAIDTKGIVPKFAFVQFDGKYIEATNGSFVIRVELDEPTPKFAIGGELFYSLLKTFKDEDVEISVDEKCVHLKTKSISTQLALPEGFQHDPFDFNVKGWKPVSTEMLDGLALCRYTACPDQTAGALTGVHIEGNDIVSCDRWRVSIFTMGSKVDTLTLSVDLIDQLKRLITKAKDAKFAVKDTTIYFDAGKVKVAGKLLDGEFPTTQLLNSLELTDGAVELKLTQTLKDNLAEAGNRQNIIQSSFLEFDRMTQVIYKKGVLKLITTNRNIGVIEESLQCDDKKDVEFMFFINPVFLLNMFKETDSLLYSEKHSVVCFEGKKFVHLVKTKVPEGKDA